MTEVANRQVDRMNHLMIIIRFDATSFKIIQLPSYTTSEALNLKNALGERAPQTPLEQLSMIDPPPPLPPTPNEKSCMKHGCHVKCNKTSVYNYTGLPLDELPNEYDYA